SPSDDRGGLDRFASTVQEVYADLGRFEVHTGERGHNLVLNVSDGPASPHAVALCHYDTVWPMGTLARIPFTVDGEGVGRGPGCFDMKAGIVVLYFALMAVRGRLARPLRVLFT